jgi:hypothetical protein
MYMVHANGQHYGPFGYYESALQFAKEHWAEKDFHITGGPYVE